MSEFDAAEAAVQAALDAGARYADARVMHRRYESMTARNGDVEAVSQDADSGLGVRALVGSGWGFFAVPDLADGAVRATPARRAARDRRRQRRCVARPGHGTGADASRRPARGRASARSTRSPSRCPTRATCWCGPPATMREHGADLAEGAVPDLGHAQVVRLQRGPPHRPAHPRVRRRDHGHGDRRRRDAAPLVPGGTRPVRHPRLGAGRASSTSRPTRPGSAPRPGRC